MYCKNKALNILAGKIKPKYLIKNSNFLCQSAVNYKVNLWLINAEFEISDTFSILKNTKWTASWQNQQNGTCTQWRLRSAGASAQSDQSLRCPHEESLIP